MHHIQTQDEDCNLRCGCPSGVRSKGTLLSLPSLLLSAAPSATPTNMVSIRVIMVVTSLFFHLCHRFGHYRNCYRLHQPASSIYSMLNGLHPTRQNGVKPSIPVSVGCVCVCSTGSDGGERDGFMCRSLCVSLCFIARRSRMAFGDIAD